MKKILSSAEILYIQEGIKLGIRSDGRSNNDIRELFMDTGNLKQANGSSKVYLSDSGTSILVGIKVNTNSIKNYSHLIFYLTLVRDWYT